ISGVPQTGGQAFLLEFSVLGQQLGMTFWMLVGAAITTAGMLIVLIGWWQLYTADDELVTSGVYAYSRHPQYVGISLIALGWFIGWP
ncbi:MAG: methyltransferase, partial [Candidatus Nanohaloarchaea archaeon]|nr:methyltransferase [Candidatus Nanohaloarchaea archaeon]